ncbi:hypothetical protein [Streptomyces thioluteus]|uniref:hypothetical protein n=1 Tax=Streptomyces thioluteus TaxID=66431 RepID=UPI0031E5D126
MPGLTALGAAARPQLPAPARELLRRFDRALQGPEDPPLHTVRQRAGTRPPLRHPLRAEFARTYEGLHRPRTPGKIKVPRRSATA